MIENSNIYRFPERCILWGSRGTLEWLKPTGLPTLQLILVNIYTSWATYKVKPVLHAGMTEAQLTNLSLQLNYNKLYPFCNKFMQTLPDMLEKTFNKLEGQTTANENFLLKPFAFKKFHTDTIFKFKKIQLWNAHAKVSIQPTNQN